MQSFFFGFKVCDIEFREKLVSSIVIDGGEDASTAVVQIGATAATAGCSVVAKALIMQKLPEP